MNLEYKFSKNVVLVIIAEVAHGGEKSMYTYNSIIYVGFTKYILQSFNEVL